jgi:hypothetical protein
MNELHQLISTLQAQLAELREHAGKDITTVKADVVSVEATIKAELGSLLSRLKAL